MKGRRVAEMMVLAIVMETKRAKPEATGFRSSVSRAQRHYLEGFVRRDTQSLCQRMLIQEVGRELRILHIFLNLC